MWHTSTLLTRLHDTVGRCVLLFFACLLFTTQLIAASTHTVTYTDCVPQVTVSVTPAVGTSAWAYEETLYGLTPSEITNNGVWLSDLSVIRWAAERNDLATDLSYKVTGFDGNYTVSGIESVDGRSSRSDEATITMACDPAISGVPVETADFSEADGTPTPVTVTVSSNTVDAVIHYTTDGSEPDTSSPVYSVPLDLTGATWLKAIAVKAGMKNSDVMTAYYPAPQINRADALGRAVSLDVCEPTVTLTVQPVAGISSYAVAEQLPLGTAPRLVGDTNVIEGDAWNGIWDAELSEIRWGSFQDDQARSLTYTLTGPDADYVLTGVASFDGYNQQIPGDVNVLQDCVPEQALAPVLTPVDARAPVTVSMSTATDGAEIRFTMDGSEPTISSILYTSPLLISNSMTLKAKTFKTDFEPSDTTSAVYLGQKRPMAIIVAGGGPFGGNALWAATQHVSNYAYHALKYQGYDRDDIMFLSRDLTVDVDGNGELDDIDGLATIANLQDAILNWAVDATDLIIYLTDHGGSQTFMMEPGEIMHVTQLDGWLDTLQATIPGRVTVIYDACQSGTFLSSLLPPTGKNRVVITSAGNEPALFLEGGVLSFSYQFWSSVFYKGDLYEAFLTGSTQMLDDQRALLDANGNGIANEKSDKLLIQGLLVGRGAVAASVPPSVGTVVGQQQLNGETSATVWVEDITSLNTINRVWAVVMPPNYRSGGVNVPITDLPTIELLDTDADGRYEGTYNDFSAHGPYRLQIYVNDSQGVISIPRPAIVVQQQGVIVPNNAPVAVDASYTIQEDIALPESLVATDADSDDLTYLLVDDGLIGTVTLTNVTTGAFTYQPHGNENGTDQFTFKVNDGIADSNLATVSITINAVEDQPVAAEQEFTVLKDTIHTGALVATDGDDDALTFSVQQPQHGVLDLTNASTGEFSYTPTAGYSGEDSFTFTAADGKALSSPATVTIHVDRGYNNPPTASVCSFSGDEDTVLPGTLLGEDPDTDPISFILVASPSQGVIDLVDADAGTFTYLPDQDYNGADTFSFKVTDGSLESAIQECAITVQPVNDAPVASNSSINVDQATGVTGTFVSADADDDSLTYAIVTSALAGTVEITDQATGSFTYTPLGTENGNDFFTYTVSDGQVVSDPAQVSVNILLPQADLSRTITDDGCVIEITIDVTPVDSVQAYAVEEIVPSGATVLSVSGDGLWDQSLGRVIWGTYLDASPRTLTYQISGDDGDYVFSGIGSFDGWNQPVTGSTQSTLACVSLRAIAPTFNPASGARVPVDVIISSDTVSAEIRYTTDGSTPDQTSLLYASAVALTDPLTLKARAYKNGLFASTVASATYKPTKSTKAIIVSGGGPYAGNNLWSATQLAAEMAYKSLLYQGYEKDDIMYLSPDTTIDVDGNGTLDDIDGEATAAQLQDAIVNWAQDSESLLLFITDHGGDQTFQLTPEEILAAADLDSWLDSLQQSVPTKVILIYDACLSGTFVSVLTPPAGLERVVITSAASESAWFINQGRLSFGYQFWASMFASGNLQDAYQQAQRMMRRYQTSQLDTNGDGIVEQADLLALGGIVLGRGAVSAGVAPVIGQSSGIQVLSTETSATISAWDISTLNSIDRVWATIERPDFTSGTPSDPVINVEELELLDSNNDGTYQALLENMILDGYYLITINAVDAEGMYAEPVSTAIQRGVVLDTDTDSDGLGDGIDADDDGDGVLDDNDAYPLISLGGLLDTDSDGRPDTCDQACIGKGMAADLDDDNDGVADVDDLYPLDPTRSIADTDLDGIGDTSDNCPNMANADQLNTDGDSQGNACDADDDNDGVVDASDAYPLDPSRWELVVEIDTDKDGIADSGDNCPGVGNPDQTDTDADTEGDACDSDDDNDGLLDGSDAYPTADITGYLDTDNDGAPDDCDQTCMNTGMSADTDDDNDGILDTADLYPLTPLGDRSDIDGDGAPDSCDATCLALGMTADDDDDNDGALDAADNCPLDYNPTMADSDGDGIGDACDTNGNTGPTIAQPGSGEVFGVSGITFSWSGVSGVSGYALRLTELTRGNTLFSGSLLGETSTSTLISLPNGEYHFSVRACTSSDFNPTNCSVESTTSFSVDLTKPTGAPTISAPAASANLTSSTQTLSWTAVAKVDDSQTLYYEVIVDDVAGGTTALQISVYDPDTSTIATLPSSTNYRMKVRACQAGCGPWSTPVNFAMTLLPVPSMAPTITNAVVTGNSLTADWSSVAGADVYRFHAVQPSGGPGGSALTVAARQVSGTSVTVPLPSGDTNLVVQACTGDGCGPYSGAVLVSPSDANPDTPNLGTPLAGSYVDGPAVEFSWSRIPGDDGSNTTYRLFVQDLSLQSTALDVHTTDNFYAAYFKAEGARYDALVVANPGPSQIVGPASGFNVIGTSSTAPTMVQPAHNSSLTEGNIQLGWTPVPGATLYEYYVAILGESGATVRGVTPGRVVQVGLSAVGGADTTYSGIVRACPSGATCVAGSDTGWGAWSVYAGPGVTNFTVVP